MNLAEIVERHPDDAVALVSRGRTTTYGELRAQVAALRGFLVETGLEPGDRVAVACGNNWYFVVAYLATLGAGGVAVPLNPAAPSPELEAQLASTEARGLVCGPAGAAAIAGIDRERLPSLEWLLAPPGVDLPGACSIDDALERDAAPMVGCGPDDLAVLMFTSGTAGAPRAAMLTHGNLLANLEQIDSHESRRQNPGDVVLGVIPLFHIFGLNVVLGTTLHSGASVVLVERFDPDTALQTVRSHGVTVVSGPPTMWAAWAGLPGADPDSFASVRLAVSGAAKLSVETAEAVRDRFGVCIQEGYGLTESSPVVTSATGTDAPWGSVGAPLPGVEVRLVDVDGQDSLAGDAGEVWVRGPNVFAGYWQEPEATAAVLTSDGWLRTGDVAVVDDDGHLFLVDRVKDLIIVSGFNVYPAEVEEVLVEHPSVRACAVVGVPHPYTGEAVKAFVVLEEGRPAEEEDLVSWCRDRLARYKCPGKVMFVDVLPQNLTGKVLRRVLR